MSALVATPPPPRVSRSLVRRRPARDEDTLREARLVARHNQREWAARLFEARSREHMRRRRKLEQEHRYVDALCAQLKSIDDQLRAYGERGLAGLEQIEARIARGVRRVRSGFKRTLALS